MVFLMRFEVKMIENGEIWSEKERRRKRFLERERGRKPKQEG